MKLAKAALVAGALAMAAAPGLASAARYGGHHHYRGAGIGLGAFAAAGLLCWAATRKR